MKTLITGCSGLVGSALVEYLFTQGHSLLCLKRHIDQKQQHYWVTDDLRGEKENPIDTVIHLAGENVADGRWSDAKKEQILKSRVEGTRELVDYIASDNDRPRLFICASAVGYYGSRGEEIVDEDSPSGDSFLAEVCRQWEKESQRISTMGIRVVNLRFGMVLSPHGGALHKMIPPFTAGMGGTIGNGKQYISWISIRDLVAIVQFIIDHQQLEGPINVVSPNPTTNREFTKSLGRALNRPTFFTIPAFMAKMIFGQMADEMLLSSTRATPRVLVESGYEFIDKSLDEVLRFCVQGAKQ